MRLQFLPLLQRHGIGIYAYRSVFLSFEHSNQRIFASFFSDVLYIISRIICTLTLPGNPSFFSNKMPKSGAKVRKICDIYKKNAKKHTKACTNSDLTRYLCML